MLFSLSCWNFVTVAKRPLTQRHGTDSRIVSLDSLRLKAAILLFIVLIVVVTGRYDICVAHVLYLFPLPFITSGRALQDLPPIAPVR